MSVAGGGGGMERCARLVPLRRTLIRDRIWPFRLFNDGGGGDDAGIWLLPSLNRPLALDLCAAGGLLLSCDGVAAALLSSSFPLNAPNQI